MFKAKFHSVGKIDLEILSELHSRHPGASVDNEVVEPSAQQLRNYKGIDTGLICVGCFPKALLFSHFPSGSTIRQSFICFYSPDGVQHYCSQLLLEFNELESRENETYIETSSGHMRDCSPGHVYLHVLLMFFRKQQSL